MRRVWVEDWQMQCCGVPFEVGAAIDWTVLPADEEWLRSLLGADEASRVTDHANHHGIAEAEQQVPLRGRVEAIRAAYCRYDLLPSRLAVPVAGTTRFERRTRVDGWEDENGDLTFVGYIVDIDDSSTPPVGGQR